MTPFEAPTHGDPYGYYATLRQHKDLFFDAELGVWIASGAHAVEAILAHPDCRVRPLHESVPAAIAQGAAGRVFGRLMRMNEGPQHRCPRSAIAPALAAIDKERVAQAVSHVRATLNEPITDPDALMFTLPVCVVAHLMGLPSTRLHEASTLTRKFVACLSPLSDHVQLQQAHGAASQLERLMSALLNEPVGDSPLLADILRERGSAEWDDPNALIANLIGLMSQTCEATAGLIGNTLIALQSHPELMAAQPLTPGHVADLVAEVARYDSPVQNTRRFVAKRCTIGDSVLEEGDTVVVLLASANRDPAANPDPDRLLLQRSHRRTFSFGSGRHECPGQQLALTLATEAVSLWLQHPPSSPYRPYQWRYLPSLNGRIPTFYFAQEPQS